MFLLPLNVAAALSTQQAPTSELTIYNQGFGFVKETRSIPMVAGIQEFAIENVAAMIEPASVSVRDLAGPGSFEVLEQNYQYDLISRVAILNKTVGHKIRFNRILPNGAKEQIVGTLVSSPTAIVPNQGGYGQQVYNGMVIKTDDGRILLDPSGEVEVDSIPEGLISVPTLKWKVDAAKAGTKNVELTYVTNGMTWSSDYVLNLEEKSMTAGLKGWVTLNNTSGKSFKNTRLKLLAGDVQRLTPQRSGLGGGAFGGAMRDMAKSANMAEESLFEYHLYTLGRPTDVRDNEQKQVSLLEADRVPYKRRVIVDSMLNFGMYYPSEGEIGTGDIKPLVKVEFDNKKEFGLGIPLPKGKVKVYQKDSSGSAQMLGEDNIDHTPKDEHVSLTIGRSFDIRATRKRTNFKRISGNSFEETFEIELRNRKEVADQVVLLERHYATWKITDNNMPSTKEDSETTQWVVDLKAGESKTVKYTVITTW